MARTSLSPLCSGSSLFREGKVWFAENHSRFSAELRAPFGVDAIDGVMGGVSLGALHEWCSSEQTSRSKEILHPPFLILGSLLRNAQKLFPEPSSKQLILWIGRRCWPTPYLLEHLFTDSNFAWRERSLFIDPRNDTHRLLATQTALASPGVLAVIVDGTRLSLTATRRLQLAAKQGNSLGCLIRPERELSLVSCAQTKWRISPFASPSAPQAYQEVQWKLELLRARGIATPLSWFLTWDYEQKNSLSLLPDSQCGLAPDREEKKSSYA